MRFLSPLRYPGGKGALGEFVGDLISASAPRRRTYVEPFAGGAGVALRLLVDEYVERVILNDLDPGITAFWRCVFRHTEALVDLVMRAEISIDEWHRHHEVYLARTGDDLELGFATFFMNRTNRSGILDARPIGGMEQAGKWRMDARFNRANLSERIRLLGRYRNRVDVREEHAVDLLHQLRGAWRECFVYADPPYIGQGRHLYLDAMGWEDHQRLARCLRRNQWLWMVTYDADDRVPEELYPTERCAEFGIAHTAADQHMGLEYAVFSDAVPVDEMVGVGSGVARWLRA